MASFPRPVRIALAAAAVVLLAVALAWLLAPRSKPIPETPAAFPNACIVYEDEGPGAKLARSRATATARCLTRAGLEVPLRPVSELDDALSPPCGVAHLVSLREPSAARLDALRAFIDRGGRLVVHASPAPSLCALFGVRPPPNATGLASPDGDWTGFAFDGATPSLAPTGLPQRTPAVLEFQPAPRSGVRVLARWHGARTPSPGPPAVLRGPAGFWLSRMLYDDASAADTGRLLLALTAELAPAAREAAAETLAARLAARRDGVSSRRFAAALLREAPAVNRPRLQSILDRITSLESPAADAPPVDPLAALWEQDQLWTQAEAVSHPLGPLRGNARLCVWSKSGWPPGTNTWESAASALAAAGVSDVYLYAGSLSGSIPEVKGVPAHPGRRFRGDPFPDAVAACHARDIRVHAWVFSLQADLREGARYAATNLTRRLLHNPDRSERLPWLDPAVRANARDLSAFACALATNAAVDGVSLDYFRYPENETNEKRSPDKLRTLLASVRADLRKAKPSCELSVCTYAYTNRVCQAWDGWLADDLCDRALVMNYAPDLETFRRYMDLHPDNRDHQICGIGAASNEALLAPEDLLEQLRAAFGAGYAGAAIYPFDERFLADDAEILELAR